MFTRSSGGKGGKNFGRWGSLKDKRVSNHAPPQLPINNCSNTQRLSTDSDSVAENVQTFQRAALYVLGEKAQMKVSVAGLMKLRISFDDLIDFVFCIGNENGSRPKNGFYTGRISGH